MSTSSVLAEFERALRKWAKAAHEPGGPQNDEAHAALEARMTAFSTLAQTSLRGIDPALVTGLRTALESACVRGDDGTAHFRALALYSVGGPASLDAVLDCMASIDRLDQVLAHEVGKSPEATAVLATALAPTAPVARRIAAARVVSNVNIGELVPALLEATKAESAALREAATIALTAAPSSPEIVARFHELAHDAEAHVRAAAAGALGTNADASAIASLIATASREGDDVDRRAAVAELGAHAARPDVHALFVRIAEHDASEIMRGDALGRIARSDADVARVLEGALTQSMAYVRWTAAAAAGRLGVTALASRLAAMSDDRDAQVRQTARASATTLGAKVPALRVALPGLPELFMREHDRSPLLANAGDRVGLEGTTVAGPPTLYSGEVVLRFDDGAVGIRFGEGDGRNGEFLGVLEKLPKANDGYVITEAAPWEKTYEAPTPRLADVARDVFRRLAPPDAVLEMDPLDLAALNAVAESRQRSGEVDDAVVMWLRAENLVKDGTHAALAVDALVFAKHIDDALALAQEYAATSPACAVRAAELLASAGHTERASAAFDAVLATPDESNSELNERAQNGKARLLFARGDVEGAAALATNPDLRADALVALGKVNEAITLLKLTAARRPHAEKKRLEARAFELECKKAILLRRKPSSAL